MLLLFCWCECMSSLCCMLVFVCVCVRVCVCVCVQTCLSLVHSFCYANSLLHMFSSATVGPSAETPTTPLPPSDSLGTTGPASSSRPSLGSSRSWQGLYVDTFSYTLSAKSLISLDVRLARCDMHVWMNLEVICWSETDAHYPFIRTFYLSYVVILHCNHLFCLFHL